MRCERGSTRLLNTTGGLPIFIEYYHKWYVAPKGTKFEFKEIATQLSVGKDGEKQGAACEEVKLEAGGSFGHWTVFCMRTINEITVVDSVLVNYVSTA